jgi:phage baseplate assembly protein W
MICSLQPSTPRHAPVLRTEVRSNIAHHEKRIRLREINTSPNWDDWLNEIGFKDWDDSQYWKMFP